MPLWIGTDGRRNAAAFIRSHPSVEVRDLTRVERLVVPQAKAAWAVLHYKAALDSRKALLLAIFVGLGLAAGAKVVAAHHGPCAQTATGIACCAISATPKVSSIRWHERRGHKILEVTGYNDALGNFVPIEPAVKIPATEIPRCADGSFNLDDLIGHHRAPVRAIAWSTCCMIFLMICMQT